MPKIRYAELPAGLHVSAKPHGRDMIIFLQPGLNAAQRRAALARVRSIGRMGYGPPVSAVGMGMAVGADKLRTTMRTGVAAMRRRPLLLLAPTFLLVCTAILVGPMSFAPGTVPQHERAVPDGFVLPGQPPPQQHGSGSGSAGRHGISSRRQGGLAPSPGTGTSPAPAVRAARTRPRPVPPPTASASP